MNIPKVASRIHSYKGVNVIRDSVQQLESNIHSSLWMIFFWCTAMQSFLGIRILSTIKYKILNAYFKCLFLSLTKLPWFFTCIIAITFWLGYYSIVLFVYRWSLTYCHWTLLWCTSNIHSVETLLWILEFDLFPG